MIRPYAYTKLRENFPKELEANPTWTVADLICWIMQEIATTSALIFQEYFVEEDYEKLRIRCVQTVDLLLRFAMVAEDSNISRRSNIHALLHVYDTALLYGTLVNVSCSPGEDIPWDNVVGY